MQDLSRALELAMDAASRMHWAEVAAVAAGLIYVVLAARENIWCWSFGILGSGLSIYLFIVSKLYAEAFLYLYYVLAGVYGWYAWSHGQEPGGELAVRTWPWKRHFALLGSGVVLALGLAELLRQYTDAQMPVLDAHTTVFSFLATYLATRKVLENWIYWIVIDAFSAYLYVSRDLFLYALLMVLYTGIAVYGFRSWQAHWRSQGR